VGARPDLYPGLPIRDHPRLRLLPDAQQHFGALAGGRRRAGHPDPHPLPHVADAPAAHHGHRDQHPVSVRWCGDRCNRHPGERNRTAHWRVTPPMVRRAASRRFAHAGRAGFGDPRGHHRPRDCRSPRCNQVRRDRVEHPVRYGLAGLVVGRGARRRGDRAGDPLPPSSCCSVP